MNEGKNEHLVTVFPSQSQSFKLIKDDGGVMIFEGGWWMDKSDWRKIWIEDRKYCLNYGEIRKTPKPFIGLDRNETTHQITIFFLPHDENYK